MLTENVTSETLTLNNFCVESRFSVGYYCMPTARNILERTEHLKMLDLTKETMPERAHQKRLVLGI